MAFLLRDTNTDYLLPLEHLDLNVAIFGHLCSLVFELKFKNTLKEEILEAELSVPLNPKAYVTGFSSDMNGQMVDAVVVSTEKARKAFNAQVHNRDFSSKSAVTGEQLGNIFKTKLCLIPPLTQRTIKITMTQHANEGSTFCFPLSSPSKISLSVSVDVYSNETPMLLLHESAWATEYSPFSSVFGGHHWSLRGHYKLDGTGFSVKSKDFAPCLLASPPAFGETFQLLTFVDRIPKPHNNQHSLNPNTKVCIVWDTSLSRGTHGASLDLDLTFVTEFISQLERRAVTSVTFCFFNVFVELHTFSTKEKHRIDDFLGALEYTGGTTANWMEQITTFDLCVLFSDGIDTAQSFELPKGHLRLPVIHAFSGSPQRDTNTLNRVSSFSGGKYYQEYTNSTIPFLVSSVLDRSPTTLQHVSSPSHIALLDSQIVSETPQYIFRELWFTMDSKAHIKPGDKLILDYCIHSGSTLCSTTLELNKVRYLEDPHAHITWRSWGHRQIEKTTNEPDAEQRDKQLKKLGKNYGLASSATSFVILSDIDEFVKHHVKPPKSLPQVRAQYKEIAHVAKLLKKDKLKTKMDYVMMLWMNVQNVKHQIRNKDSANHFIAPFSIVDTFNQPFYNAINLFGEESKKRKHEDIAFQRRLKIPFREFPDYNFLGLLHGPRGSTKNWLERTTKSKILLPALVKSPKSSYDIDDCWVTIIASDSVGLEEAVKQIESLLTPIEEGMNQHKRAQLRSLAEINGTIPDTKWTRPSCDLGEELKSKQLLETLGDIPDACISDPDAAYDEFMRSLTTDSMDLEPGPGKTSPGYVKNLVMKAKLQATNNDLVIQRSDQDSDQPVDPRGYLTSIYGSSCAQNTKPIPAPNDVPRMRRAGKKQREAKEKYSMTDLKSKATGMSFGYSIPETSNKDSSRYEYTANSNLVLNPDEVPYWCRTLRGLNLSSGPTGSAEDLPVKMNEKMDEEKEQLKEKPKTEIRFLQKYYHKGAFFADEIESESSAGIGEKLMRKMGYYGPLGKSNESKAFEERSVGIGANPIRKIGYCGTFTNFLPEEAQTPAPAPAPSSAPVAPQATPQRIDRRVINKYLPPDFDLALLPKTKEYTSAPRESPSFPASQPLQFSPSPFSTKENIQNLYRVGDSVSQVPRVLPFDAKATLLFNSIVQDRKGSYMSFRSFRKETIQIELSPFEYTYSFPQTCGSPNSEGSWKARFMHSIERVRSSTPFFIEISSLLDLEVDNISNFRRCLFFVDQTRFRYENDVEITKFTTHLQKKIWMMRPEEPVACRCYYLALIEECKARNETTTETVLLIAKLFKKLIEGTFGRKVSSKQTELIVLQELKEWLYSLERKDSMNCKGTGPEESSQSNHLVAFEALQEGNPFLGQILTEAFDFDDIRITIEWDNPNADVELIVTEPNGQALNAFTNISNSGGYMTTSCVGYGPIQYSIRNALKGVYDVNVRLFSCTGDLKTNPVLVFLRLWSRRYCDGLSQIKSLIILDELKTPKPAATLRISL